jgi:hypothetical protein
VQEFEPLIVAVMWYDVGVAAAVGSAILQPEAARRSANAGKIDLIVGLVKGYSDDASPTQLVTGSKHVENIILRNFKSIVPGPPSLLCELQL